MNLRTESSCSLSSTQRIIFLGRMLGFPLLKLNSVDPKLGRISALPVLLAGRLVDSGAFGRSQVHPLRLKAQRIVGRASTRSHQTTSCNQSVGGKPSRAVRL